MTPARQCFHTVIQPEQAKLIAKLTDEQMANFRKCDSSMTRVQAYAEAMRNGTYEWRDAHPIRLSSDLLTCSDGLSRLTACAVSGVPLQTLVLIGDEWTAGLHTDRGSARTLAQIVAYLKVPNASSVAAIVREHTARVAAFERGVGLHHARNVLTNEDDYIGFLEQHRSVLESVASRAKCAFERNMTSSGYGVVLLQLALADSDLADELHSLMADDPTEALCPFTQLRAFAMRHSTSSSKRFNQQWTINNVIKAWNQRSTGESLKMWKPALWDDVRWPLGGSPSDWKITEGDQ